MNADTFLRDLVTQLEPNATVVGIEEREGAYRVRVTGTIGVVADCELPRADVMGGPEMAPQLPQRSERPGKAGSLLSLTGAGRASHGPPRR